MSLGINVGSAFPNFPKFSNLPNLSLLTRPFDPSDPFCPLGFSPQAKRLLSNNSQLSLFGCANAVGAW